MALTTVQPGIIGIGSPQAGAALNSGVPISENLNTVSYSYCVTTGSNAISAGPIVFTNGATVTVPDGSVWTIV